MAYATAVEYTTARGEAMPGDEQALAALERRLESASDRLDELAVTAVYAVDVDGMPTSAAVASAFRAACVEQAAWMLDHEDEAPSGATQLGTLNLPATTGHEGRYAPEAVALLQRAGLLGTAVQAPRQQWLRWGFL